jgi:hypothetical protein
MSLASYTTARPAASAADPLGFDMKVGADLDPSGRSATGLELVEDAILHRLQEDRISMIGAPGDEIDFGENVRAWVGEALSDEALAAKTPRVEEVLRRDVRIADLTVRITKATGADASRWDLLVQVLGVTISGQTIDRIVGASSLTVEFLAAGR